MKRATATAAALFALAAAGAAEAQDVFLKCKDMYSDDYNFFRFNVSNNSIHRFSQDGEDLGSICVLPREYIDQRPGGIRWRDEHTNIRCTITATHIEILANRDQWIENAGGPRSWTNNRSSIRAWRIFQLDRRTGTVEWWQRGTHFFGNCLPIERPQPRANLF
jgi:hypothetical protein